MRTVNLKFGLLAALCLLAVVPIIGNVQKQAAVTPNPGLDHDALRRARHAYQRRALRQWLLGHTDARYISESSESSRVMNVVLSPGLTHSQIISQAQTIQQIMGVYFREGPDGAVTRVDLRSSNTEIHIVTDSHAATARDHPWQLLEQGKKID